MHYNFSAKCEAGINAIKSIGPGRADSVRGSLLSMSKSIVEKRNQNEFHSNKYSRNGIGWADVEQPCV